MKKTQLSLDDEIHSELKLQAAKYGITMARLINEVMVGYLEKTNTMAVEVAEQVRQRLEHGKRVGRPPNIWGSSRPPESDEVPGFAAPGGPNPENRPPSTAFQDPPEGPVEPLTMPDYWPDEKGDPEGEK